MKVYYAHPITEYGTEQESRDLVTLAKLGFEVLNPNQASTASAYKAAREKANAEAPLSDPFAEVFKPLVLSCDAVFFRSFADGRIGSGVLQECEWAHQAKKPVLEFPTFNRVRCMTISETRERIRLWREGPRR